MAGANPNPALADGRWDFVCVSSNGAAGTSPEEQVVIEGADLIEVRLPFGAEADERFNWETV